MTLKIIVGDIHGCYRELTKLLEKVGFDKEKDRLISLGDLMDRGNHEEMMLEAALFLGDDLWKPVYLGIN